MTGLIKKLLIVVGPEGSGKTTLAKAILPHLDNGAAFDAEQALQVNPWEFNEAFEALALDQAATMIETFYRHGYERVFAGSFMNSRRDYDRFRQLLKSDPVIFVLFLMATKSVRDQRRIERDKPSTQEDRDWLDQHYPLDTSLRETQKTGDYTYIEVDNSDQTIAQTICEIKSQIPDFFS